MFKLIDLLLLIFIGLKMANRIPPQHEVPLLLGIVTVNVLFIQSEGYRRKIVHDPQSNTTLQSMSS